MKVGEWKIVARETETERDKADRERQRETERDMENVKET